ncbi:hypothetical protein VDGL01_00838 [Verticillium dahliae]
MQLRTGKGMGGQRRSGKCKCSLHMTKYCVNDHSVAPGSGKLHLSSPGACSCFFTSL